MALLDRPRFAQLAETLEERVGLSIMPFSERARLEETEERYVALAGDAEDLAMRSLDYGVGRPSELTHERRMRIAQRSRIALKFDPLAGAEAQLLADFSFGKGLPVPTARDPRVQEIIEEAWTDANNEEKLTGFMAQRKLSNELLTTGELFITLYVAGGRIRVGRLDPDTVEAVVPDPEDRLRPLWYMVRERRFKWNFEQDRMDLTQSLNTDGRTRVRYWKHWRNYDDAVREREMGMVDDGEEPLETPPEDRIGPGVVFHIAINQTGEELRGNPPWARTLRFMEAMNVLTESHVAMAQAASSFIARRTVAGTPRAVARAAASVLGQLSELGAARFDAQAPRPLASDAPMGFAPRGAAPAPPGSWWTENPTSRLEALNLQSGSGQMAQTGQIVRAPLAAASGFGQHYLGDASAVNLSSASTLELPSTMHVESWQALFEQGYRWFIDRAIEAAVKAGRLGGLDGYSDEGPLGEMRLHEAEDRAAMERRTRTDLSYDFVMPFPGRRQLAEVAGFVTEVAGAMDPNGVARDMRRQLLRFAYETMGMPDVGRAVEEAIPDTPIPGGIGDQGAAFGGAVPPQAGGDPNAPPEDAPRNVKRTSTPPGERRRPNVDESWLPEELRPAAEAFADASVERFRRTVGDEAVVALLKLAPAANGSGG